MLTPIAAAVILAVLLGGLLALFDALNWDNPTW